MARKPTKQQLRAILDELEPGMRKAFLESVEGLRSNINEQRLTALIESHNIEAVLQFLNIDESSYRPLQRHAEGAFEEGGNAATKILKRRDAATASFRFDIRHPTADSELREYGATLVTRLSDDQRYAVRQVLANGIAEGRSPRSTALDLVGRYSRLTGRREGGIIGLTSAQAGYVENMRRRLQSGDKAELIKIFDMSRRDKRFDAAIRKAIASGQPIDQSKVVEMVTRYADRLLQTRGETIARTETMMAFNKGQMEAMQQAIAAGYVNSGVVTKVWHAFMDERTRFSHRKMNKAKIGINEKFVTPRGRFMAYPGDPEGGVDECVNCRCWLEFVIDFLADID